MVSAVKLVVASATVALVGGFLLSGILTTQYEDESIPAAVGSPSPATTADLLAGMVTEEVEPGVYRVLDDGAGHVPGAIGGGHVMPRSLDRLHIEPDGSVWVMTTVYGDDWGKPDDKAVAWRVGVEGRYGQEDRFPGHEYPNRMPSDLTMATAPDGTLWAAGGWGLGSFDGDRWTAHGDGNWANTVSILPGGTVWAAWPDRIGRYGPRGWEMFDTGDGVPREVYQFAAAPDGRIFAIGSGRLVGFDGTTWQDVRPVHGDVDAKVIGLRDAPDGTLWAHLSDLTWSHDRVEPWLVRGLAADTTNAQQHYLAHFDGDAWVVYSPTDGVPRVAGPDQKPNWEVHPDGSVWVLDDTGTLLSFDDTEWTERTTAVERFTIGPAGSVWAITPDGVASFAGEGWTRYERPIGSDALDVAPNGTAWLLSNEDGHGLFVITPDTVAAREAMVTEPPTNKEPTDAQAAATTTEELLAGMVTEEVEPGVFLVVNDGVRDLGALGGTWGQHGGATTGADGAVWINTAYGRYYRLGERRTLDLPREWLPLQSTPPETFGAEVLHAGPSGQLWARDVRSGRVNAWIQGEWIERADLDNEAMAVDAANEAWAASGWGLLHIDGEGEDLIAWPDEHGRQVVLPYTLAVSDDGTAHALSVPVGEDSDMGEIDSLVRYDGNDWSAIPLPSPISVWFPGDGMDVGADGTVWVAADQEITHHSLARLDGSRWTVFTADDGVGPWGGKHGFVPEEMLSVSTDGSVWVDASAPREDSWSECDGVARFDGSSWSHFLSGRCIADIDFAPDGSAWVLASAEYGGRVETYVITLDAVSTNG